MERDKMTVEQLLRETRMYPGCVSAGEAAAELGKRCADAQRALDAEREKVKFGSCEVCWNLAWVLCRDDEPNAVPMKCANGTTYWRCDYCWYKQQLATLQAQLRQVEGERAKWEDIAGLRFAGDHKFVKEMELLKVENTTLRQLVEALINTWVNGRKIHDGIPLTLRQQIDATLAAKDAGKEVPSA